MHFEELLTRHEATIETSFADLSVSPSVKFIEVDFEEGRDAVQIREGLWKKEVLRRYLECVDQEIKATPIVDIDSGLTCLKGPHGQRLLFPGGIFLPLEINVEEGSIEIKGVNRLYDTAVALKDKSYVSALGEECAPGLGLGVVVIPIYHDENGAAHLLLNRRPAHQLIDPNQLNGFGGSIDAEAVRWGDKNGLSILLQACVTELKQEALGLVVPEDSLKLLGLVTNISPDYPSGMSDFVLFVDLKNICSKEQMEETIELNVNGLDVSDISSLEFSPFSLNTIERLLTNDRCTAATAGGLVLLADYFALA